MHVQHADLVSVNQVSLTGRSHTLGKVFQLQKNWRDVDGESQLITVFQVRLQHRTLRVLLHCDQQCGATRGFTFSLRQWSSVEPGYLFYRRTRRRRYLKLQFPNVGMKNNRNMTLPYGYLVTWRNSRIYYRQTLEFKRCGTCLCDSVTFGCCCMGPNVDQRERRLCAYRRRDVIGCSDSLRL